ncbi:MAG: alpha/beta hydrolase [Hyphomonadaceae bacterium]|nr:alpha/beta hydrolase [Hyphomonadaceae bacterium]
MTAPASTRIPVADGNIFCTFAGPRDGVRPALLLLHGWTLDHRMWAPQLAAFANERLVLAPDRRGFGQSDAPPDAQREAGDLIAILNQFGAETAVVVGMSQAGRIALELGLRHRARLAALVLQGARFGAGAPEIPLRQYEALARAGQLDEVRRLWAAHPLMRAATQHAEAAAAAMLAAYDGRDLLAPTKPLPELAAQDLDAIAAPALIVTGALDTPLRIASAAALAEALPGAGSEVLIEGAGHLCNLDQPELYDQALRAFLRQHQL